MKAWICSIVLGATVALGACGDDGTADGDGDGGGSSSADGDGDGGGSSSADGDEGSGGDGDAGGGEGNGGGGSADGPGHVDSGVDPSQAATEVSAQDAQTLCTAFETAIDHAEEVHIDCTASAVMDTQDETACIERRDHCIEAESGSGQDDGCDGAEIVQGLSTCASSVTAGDIEDCLNEQLAWEASLTCADAGSATPPACFGKLLSDCPDLFDGPDGDTEGGSAGSGGGSSSTLECDENAAAAAQIDCETWCAPLAEVACQSGPNLEECMFVCEESKTVCPGLAGALASCQETEGAVWECDEAGEPDLTSCDLELVCFGDCVDMITQ